VEKCNKFPRRCSRQEQFIVTTSQKLMISKNQTKSKKYMKNNRRKNSNIVNPSLLGNIQKKIIQGADTIQSANGSGNVNFSSTTANYINLSLINTLTDFTNIADAYQLCRIRKIHLRVSRIASESNISTVYTGGMGPLHIAYYPASVATTYTNTQVVINETSLRMPVMENSTGFKTWMVPNSTLYYATGTADYAINLYNWFPTSRIANICGQFSVGSIIPAVAASTSTLFSIEYRFEVDFCCPY
jgi:hypothetical protein